MRQIKIHESEHLKHPLLVHALLSDFELEDVWRVPVALRSDHSLKLFMDLFKKTDMVATKNGLPGLLLRFRMFLGKVFGWDAKVVHDKLIPGTIRERYARLNGLSYNDLPHPGSSDFVPVYVLENEFLSEIENKTVHAAIHFSRIPLREKVWGIHMAIYVKPNGKLGRLYMLLIKPFRLWIVYPAMMNAAQRKWNSYVKESLP